MDSGQLNKPISILAQTTTRDSAGGVSQIWNTVLNTWAARDIQQSALEYETAEFVSKVTYKITIRYRTDIILDNSKRIQYVEPVTRVVHTYEIKAVLNPKAENVWLVLICYELNGQE